MARIAPILTLMLALMPVTGARADSPVVVELFSSQGCSACPPADALLAELATRDDVIALGLHVDYWDYIGWADTFASPQFTRRQYAYARAAGRNMVYTPQMIIGGNNRVMGNEPMQVADLIMAHRDAEYPVRITMSRVDSMLTVRAEAAMALPEYPMIVQIVRYDPMQTVEIARGENAGSTITYANIVTEWTRIGEWTGEAPFSLSLGDASDDPVVAIVQMAGPGAILGAARLD
jgi:hypothetical protein